MFWKDENFSKICQKIQKIIPNFQTLSFGDRERPPRSIPSVLSCVRVRRVEERTRAPTTGPSGSFSLLPGRAHRARSSISQRRPWSSRSVLSETLRTKLRFLFHERREWRRHPPTMMGLRGFFRLPAPPI